MPVPFDRALTGWSRLLWGLALLTLALNVAQLSLLWFEPVLPITLTSGDEVWSTDFHDQPRHVQIALIALVTGSELPWIFAVVQIALLGRDYMRGTVFTENNTRRFQKIGLALIALGVFGSLLHPAIAALLFAFGGAPWMADMAPLFTLEIDYLMAGLLFFVIGKIMQRGLELQTSDQFTI
ncbi:MAG: DUF2975 domain-containing protein [Rhodobacteraceae bacterium]|nr:DUF2975 domain-containing protein [Paracoccaceae bacterium]